MNNDLILMIFLVIALIFGNLWLLKRNSKAFAARRKPSPPVSQQKQNKPNQDTATTDSSSVTPAKNQQNSADQSVDDAGGAD